MIYNKIKKMKLTNLILILFIFSLTPIVPPKVIKPYKGIIVPAYFYDEFLWQKIINTKYSLNYFIIANVNNGPGKIVDLDYKKWISILNKSGKRILGYVYSSYAKRDINLVKKDIESWIELYPEIKGFFIDEVSDSKDKKELYYYIEIYKYIKNINRNFYVILNPGNFDINLELLKFSDSIVVFEDDYKEFKKIDLPLWLKEFSQNKFISIVYNVPKNEVLNVYQFLKDKGVGIVYITDDKLPNPYDSLPSYYDFLIKIIYLPTSIIPIPPIPPTNSKE
jgi:hypothetical protein